MIDSTIPVYHEQRSKCGDCGCENDIVRCSTKQDRIRASGKISVVEAGPGEKTTFYRKTGILMLSRNFSTDGTHNASFKKWDLWYPIFFPDQRFVRINESINKDPSVIEEVLKIGRWLSSPEYRDMEFFGKDRINASLQNKYFSFL